MPATSPLASTMQPAYPVWMDVENGKNYPVFDAHRDSGPNGLFTFPDDAPTRTRTARRRTSGGCPRT